jgi:hypothetical protein
VCKGSNRLADAVATWCDEDLTDAEKIDELSPEFKKQYNNNPEFQHKMNNLLEYKKQGQIRIFDMQTGSSADLTNLVISTLIETDEARMSAKTKVLLSVKYRRSDAMQRVLIKEGIELKTNDISKDPRPLQYAAYHDLDLTFDHLRSHGFDSAGSSGSNLKKGSSHLDTLILAEMHAGFRQGATDRGFRGLT